MGRDIILILQNDLQLLTNKKALIFHSFYKIAVATASVLVSFSAHSEANEPGHTPNWTCKGHHAEPARWVQLDPVFESCDIGHPQSPIDVRKRVMAEAPAQAANTRGWSDGQLIARRVDLHR